jgi:hypothetical protein
MTERERLARVDEALGELARGLTAAQEAVRAALADPGDEMDDAERVALDAVLDESDADVAAGRVYDAADVLAALRAQ